MNNQIITDAANKANGYLVFAKESKAPVFNEGFIEGAKWALPKWIEIKTIDDLPKDEGQYMTLSKADYYPFYRKDVFCGRLTNSFDPNTNKCAFTHYALIEFPDNP